MISDKVLDLINRDLDGTLTEKEKAELNREVEKSPETKETVAKLRLLHKQLGEISEVEPPADLKENVMREIPMVRRSAVRQDGSIYSKIVDLFSIPRFQLAGMFALGAAAALLFLVITQNVGDNQHTPAEKVIGTIVSPEIAKKAIVVESKDVMIDGQNVRISTSRINSTVIANISISGVRDKVVQIQTGLSEAENFRFSGVEYNAPNIIQANFNNDFFSVALAGSGSLALVFDDPERTTKTLEIELKTDQSLVKETVVIQ